MPVAPQQTSKEWYVGSRLGYSTCTWYCWPSLHKDLQSGIYVTYVSRIVEKSTHYALATMWVVLRWLSEEGLLFGHEHIHFWTDCGPS